MKLCSYCFNCLLQLPGCKVTPFTDEYDLKEVNTFFLIILHIIKKRAWFSVDSMSALSNCVQVARDLPLHLSFSVMENNFLLSI